jgi:hypothetical protein
MPNSPLSFASSSSFRDSLLAKNLSPYGVTGVYSPVSSDLDTETVLSNFNVIDSPNDYIANDPFASQLYPLNQFGPNGGFNTTIDYNGAPLPVNSNQGEYNPTDTVLDLINEFYIDAAYVVNNYGPVGGYNDLVEIGNDSTYINPNNLHIPYGSNFVPSSYSPYSVLLNQNPNGDNGALSQDSYLAKIGAQQLKDAFQERIYREIEINTVGMVNLESLQDPFEASLLVTGQQPLIYKDWTITVPENPIVGVADLITKLGSAYWPVSLIPGDYFEDNTQNGQTQQTSTALNVTNQLTGGLLSPILNKKRNPSEIFLYNTGNGQRSSLFSNLNYNRYQPSYDKTYGGILGVGQAIFNAVLNSNGTLSGGYYVGSKNAEPSSITSPANQVPVNAFGKQEDSPVYGPSELGILYEGNVGSINFGLAGKSTSDGGSIDGEFVWVSPKYKASAGYHATPGGGIGSSDVGYNLVSSNYTRDESTNITFKETSILDETQRLVNSADNVQGISRLKHVGNAINQVSKVFHDGYKEMTKGSQVVSYTDQTTGGEAGIEYCRVFTKDTPYYTYNDLQKIDGITTSGRRFTNSVLDNTFNLNITPTRNPGSTNIVADVNGRGGYAKKYMFSIENLAWRTSSRPGFTYDELPVCEKGPNGGRVMWFPPYDLKFSDSSSANWQSTTFLGRPEPIYTYKDTNRSGTLSWSIIVDHPSIMNVIVEKQLKGQNKEKINSIIDSFFAGCVKYDIYQLALKFNTIPVKDLYTYQEILSNPQSTPEEIQGVVTSIPDNNNTNSDNISGSNTAVVDTDNSITDFQNRYKEFAFYFDNDVPGPHSTSAIDTTENFLTDYNTYVDSMNIGRYQSYANGLFNEGSLSRNTTDFFNNVIISNFKFITEGEKNFIVDAYNILKDKKGTITIDMIGSASAPASTKYNTSLSLRRNTSIINFLKTFKVGDACLGPFINDKTLIIKPPQGAGETISVPITPTGFGAQVNCTKDIKDKNGKSTHESQIYSVDAMACRRVKIQNIKVNPTPPPAAPKEEPKVVKDPSPTGTTTTFPKPEPKVTIEQKLKDGISKKILRQLLSECDYFEVIQKENPMLYSSIQEKVKYFNPIFHSITPEGLNARLTFLNQCVRPGETIPIIGTDGKPRYNDAINTSFGAPPILVLRIGDFYNTKIIPKSVQFSYDPLVYDMNPEGIGVQPMIAKVSMNFDMIGGMGLAKPVEQLQNALSFNYYGNTEIYDERAVWTEDTSALDKQVLQSILDSQPPVKADNVTTPKINNGGTTIGEILTNIPVTSGQTGNIDYMKVMDKLLDVTKDYYLGLVNKSESITKSYNNGIWQIISTNRLYSTGKFLLNGENTIDVPIYGKSDKVEEKINEIFTSLISDINTDNGTNKNYLISGLLSLQFTDATIQNVKTNLNQYINDYKSEFSTGIFTSMQELTTQQENMVQYFRQINLVDSKTDGLITDKGVPRVYSLSGTSEVNKSSPGPPTDTYEELWKDYQLVGLKLQDFDDLMKNPDPNGSLIIIPPSLGSTPPGDFIPTTSSISGIENKRMFVILARIFSDKNKLKDFETKIISGNLTSIKSPHNLSKKFSNLCDDFADMVKTELKQEEKNYTDFKKKQGYLKYINQTVYDKGKLRKFNYTTVVNSSTIAKQSEDVSKLYKSGTDNQDKTTWTDKPKFN